MTVTQAAKAQLHAHADKYLKTRHIQMVFPSAGDYLLEPEPEPNLLCVALRNQKCDYCGICRRKIIL